MPEITPRWEWRIFAPRLKAAGDWLASHTSTGTQESDEVYFLCEAESVVKLRSNLLDIKLLRETDAGGLQRWEPVLKAEFPISADDVTRAFAAIPLALPPLSRSKWSVSDFTRDFAGEKGPMRAVAVRKKRIRYAL